ncbi:serine/threonine protein kinase [Durotheca rogersii]|uniref:serine/threonine protein kinase n=1 Tax=Durotheca rogersii TaxID=419775 RepID=UPI0022205C7E|nr:serine/threonine protein kinase [Durotheca rogersii]KAI5859499.1 serine/threonine protein kinase [Durotheca rogersii]
MASPLQLGQTLRGRLSTYSVIKELHRAADHGAVYLRLQNEATVLKQYQARSRFFRPLEDEIDEPEDPPSIVLKYLDSDLRTESDRQQLTWPEIKQVAKCALEALRTLHQDGMVHTDIELDNIFVNLGWFDRRFPTIQRGDCGGVVPKHSKLTQEDHLIDASFTRSPEAQLHLSPTTTLFLLELMPQQVLTLLCGGGLHLFNPANEGIKSDRDEYELEITDENASTIVEFIHSMGPPTKPFHLVARREILPADRDFVFEIMKLDPRDRPTAEELLYSI